MTKETLSETSKIYLDSEIIIKRQALNKFNFLHVMSENRQISKVIVHG